MRNIHVSVVYFWDNIILTDLTQFTWYTARLFKTYNLKDFSIFTKLCNHHHYSILEHFHHTT